MNKEYVVCAAIRYPDEETPIHTPKSEGGVILCGLRHAHIIHQYNTLTGRITPTVKHDFGFVTSANRYVDRIEAAKIAFEAGQITQFYDGIELYSEDLIEFIKL